MSKSGICPKCFKPYWDDRRKGGCDEPVLPEKPTDDKLKDAESYLRISITELSELDLKNIPFNSYRGISQVMANYADKSHQLGRDEVIDLVMDFVNPQGGKYVGKLHPNKELIEKLFKLKEQKK